MDHIDETPRPFDKHIPKLFFVFFLVVFIANGALVSSAFNSWTGLVQDNHYEKGRAYNEELANKRALIEADLVPRASLETDDQTLTLVLEFDRMPDTVSAELVRPMGELDAIALPLTLTGERRLSASVPRPQAGQWDLDITIGEGDADYQTVRRHFVPRP